MTFSITSGLRRNGRLHRGFSIIELMVAMFLGILVTGGIITLFGSTSQANRIQTQLARMQEQGRFAVQRVVDDMRMGNAQYCSNSGGLPANTGSSVAPIYLQDQINTPTVFVNQQALPGMNFSAPGAPTEPYPLPPDFYMRGFECSNTSCTPAAPSWVPANMGTSAGDRIRGSDIYMVRALSSRGWSLDAGYSTQAPAATSTSGAVDLTSITLAPSASTEPPASYFKKDDLAMVADCSQSQVFAVTKSGNVLTPDMTKNFSAPGLRRPQLADRASTSDPRLFDFTRDFATTTYYLELKADDNPDAPSGRLVGVLMRKINNEPAEELVRGVERFDLRYGVAGRSGAIAYLTANQVDSRAGGTLQCPVDKNSKYVPATWKDSSGQFPGCLWRSVKTIEVSMLLNGVAKAPLSDAELHYMYPPDGTSVQTPPASPTNGLDRDMLRRGFTAVISVRNNNF